MSETSETIALFYKTKGAVRGFDCLRDEAPSFEAADD